LLIIHGFDRELKAKGKKSRTVIQLGSVDQIQLHSPGRLILQHELYHEVLQSAPLRILASARSNLTLEGYIAFREITFG
jgi:hypothetical protein